MEKKNINITGFCSAEKSKNATWQLFDDRLVFKIPGWFGKVREVVVPLSNIRTLQCKPEKNCIWVTGNNQQGSNHCGMLYFDMRDEADAKKYEAVVEHIGNNCSDYEYIITKTFADKEWIIRCNVCGHVFCYTYADLEKNARFEQAARTYTRGAVVNALVGTQMGMYEDMKLGNDAIGRITDYSRCPHCNSSSLTEITDNEWTESKSAEKQPAQQIVPSSAADEIKKFKELLDSGIISQEEFEAKKKQLLGL